MNSLTLQTQVLIMVVEVQSMLTAFQMKNIAQKMIVFHGFKSAANGRTILVFQNVLKRVRMFRWSNLYFLRKDDDKNFIRNIFLNQGQRIPIPNKGRCADIDSSDCTTCNMYYDSQSHRYQIPEDGICVWFPEQKRCGSMDWAKRSEKLFDQYCTGNLPSLLSLSCKLN